MQLVVLKLISTENVLMKFFNWINQDYSDSMTVGISFILIKYSEKHSVVQTTFDDQRVLD
jgi:hypothetical protein